MKTTRRFKIVPERLRTLRDRKGLSRAQLAKKSRVSQRQIQRIEDPSPSGGSVRELTLASLATALQVERGVLTGEMSMPDGGPVPNQDAERVQIGALIRPEVRLAYALVKWRYGIRATHIINMAPLFFVLLAEGSLAWRREKVLELEEAMKRMREIGAAGDHLLYANCVYRAEDGAKGEWKSIEGADLFGQHLSDEVYDFGGDVSAVPPNPFTHYLSKLADDLNRPGAVTVQRDSLSVGDFPSYKVCRDDLDTIAGDSPRAQRALTSGRVQLSEIPPTLMISEAATERMKWLESKVATEPIDSGPQMAEMEEAEEAVAPWLASEKEDLNEPWETIALEWLRNEMDAKTRRDPILSKAFVDEHIAKVEELAKAEARRRAEVMENRPRRVLNLGYGKGDDK